MTFENTSSFAQSLDDQDILRNFRNEFYFPDNNSRPINYLCGNSLGLQPRSLKNAIENQLQNWEKLGVEGWFDGENPWMYYHKEVKRLLAPLVGASELEVCPMNTLTVNLHLLLISFYKPTKTRFKILMEANAFPSDQYAIESQIRHHGLDPKEAIVEVKPKDGNFTISQEDILEAIQENKDSLSLILFGGVNYFTGQLFDMAAITKAGHEVGAFVGFDLAHAAGNVKLELHNWQVDFACWCSYKYQNSGPGGISAIFVHENHFNNPNLNRLAGWWGYNESNRFKMESGFIPELGADGWQISCTQVIPLTMYHASLKLFEKAGYMDTLREKSVKLTSYLYFLIQEVNNALGIEQYKIITPEDENQRGAQLSIIAQSKGKEIFDELVENNVLGDWRSPNVIRLSPVPLYNSFADVHLAAQVLFNVSKKLL
ncbi:kynureninase [Pedobacter flavus]|uniref:Kynureninase n=1 Tax=Pedobacter flavus TaxID=3113906 RepID=A0ABU7H2T1_9SPHI|nr:kynureninase [Pedobacter sp. VNH31]MEE1885546.1 kynureninase [Pedobacter sp. VNH31]